jgi:hypothetical protein
MTISITLPPDTEKRLRAEADAAGKDIGTFVVEAVEARLSLGKLNLRDVLSPVHEGLRKSGMTDAELDALLDETLKEARAERKSRPRPSP